MSIRPTYEMLEQQVNQLKQELMDLRQSPSGHQEASFLAASLGRDTLLRTLISTIPDLVWLKDAGGKYLYCNPKFETFFGAPESEIRGKTDDDFLAEPQADAFRRHGSRVMARNRAEVYEQELTFAADGYHGVFEIIKTPVHDQRGRLLGVLGIARDITLRKAAEAALKKTEERYAEASRLARLGFWERDFERDEAYWSDETYAIFGVSREHFQPSWEKFMEIIHPSDRYMVKKQVETTLNQRNPMDFRYRIIRPDGAERVIHSVGRVYSEDGSPPSRIMGTVHDITETERLREQLQQSQKMESIGTLAGGIAHDFNNILSSIMGYTQLAMQAAEPDSVQESDLREVYAASERAKELVWQILTFARQAEDPVRPVQIGTITREALKFLRSSIPVTIDIRQDIASESYVMGNPTQIHQIIMNLCTNAAQAMEASPGVLSVAVHDVTLELEHHWNGRIAPPGDYVEILVEDTGKGIPPETIGSIFDPYFTTKKKGDGTGMGLAVVQGIVDKSAGMITVENRRDRGASFRVLLPVTDDRELQQVYESGLPPRGSERVLFVDDEPAIVEIAKRALEHLGYGVEACTGSYHALELFKSGPQRFDLVISDVTMPEMAGDELAVELMKVRPDIPVILCTGYNKKITDDKMTAIGVKSVIYKPIISSELARAIRRVMTSERHGGGA